MTSILLTLQPVLSVIFAALIIDESPSRLQLAGAGCILAGLIVATVGRRPVKTRSLSWRAEAWQTELVPLPAIHNGRTGEARHDLLRTASRAMP